MCPGDSTRVEGLGFKVSPAMFLEFMGFIGFTGLGFRVEGSGFQQRPCRQDARRLVGFRVPCRIHS